MNEKAISTLNKQTAQSLLRLADLSKTEEITRIVKANKTTTNTTNRSLIIMPTDDQTCDELIESLGIKMDDLSNAEGMSISDIPCMMIDINEGSISMPAEPIEKIAGISWEAANPNISQVRAQASSASQKIITTGRHL